MSFDVRHIPGIRYVNIVWPCAVVRLRFDHVAFATKDSLESRRSVHNQGIWTITEDGSFKALVLELGSHSHEAQEHTILLLQPQQPDVSILLSCVPVARKVRYL